MTRTEEREIFLKYIADLYSQNDVPISHSIIYHELSRFKISNGEHDIIDNDSLLAVQLNLNNKYRTNSKVNTFSNGYFWVIENRGARNDKEFFSDMYNSVKLYVSVDGDNIYKISDSLFSFLIEEDIVMQSKIAKGMRNDALVCRVASKEDAIKVSKFLNKLNYGSSIKPNPFVYDNGKVGVTMDGNLSYNSTLARLMKEYFDIKKTTNTLDSVSSDDFSNFIKNQIEYLKGNCKGAFLDLYQINSEDNYKSFIMICGLITKNLDNSLNFDELFKYQEIGNIQTDNNKVYTKQDEDKILYVINKLSNYYSVDDVHKIIVRYIETGNIRVFTRKDDIRTIISKNYSQEDVKNIISNLGWKSFISASKVTHDKYGEEWLYKAIEKFFIGKGISGFTRDGDVRSRLGLIIPPQLLKEVIVRKLKENNMDVSSMCLTQLVLEEINKMEEKKVNGRK